MKKIIIVVLSLLLAFANLTASAAQVYYNVKTHKYHNFSCRYVPKCTVNCIKLEKARAKSRGGVPCKVCGG